MHCQTPATDDNNDNEVDHDNVNDDNDNVNDDYDDLLENGTKNITFIV